ncbi:unnamed protein product, partial [Brenthis ino]
MANTNRVSNDQLEELLEFLSEHPTLAKGVGLGARSKEAVDKQWDSLATKLNSHGSGSSKSGQRWKKYWADIKHKSKARLAKWRRDALGTGGGPCSQDDLSEVDKKILSIIGEQAVFGDTEHRIPFITEQLTPEPSTSYELPNNKADDVHIMVLTEPLTVASPSTRGQTSNLCTSQIPETGSVSVKMDINTEPPLTGLDSPVARPRIYRPRRLNSPYKSKTTVQSKIDPEWVKGLENRRVDAETKLAEAALIMAESTRTQAEAAKVQADTMRSLVELVRVQQENIHALIELIREKQEINK